MVVALVVKGTSWLPPKEQVQVRLLARVLFGGFDGEREITRLCEGRVPGSSPGWSTVAELQAAARPGCEPGLCGCDSRRPPAGASTARRTSTPVVKECVRVR